MKHSRWIALGLVLVLVLIGTAIFFSSRDPGPVAKCGRLEVDNTRLNYYYWSEYFYFSGAYGSYLANTVDFSKPLKDQSYDNIHSWEDYLLDETLQTVRDNLVMVQAAQEAGFTLPEDYDGTYQQVLVNFTAAAREQGYEDLDGYLRASYGPGADRQSFEDYLYQSHLAAAYADLLLEQCLPADEDCRAHFAANTAHYETYYDAVADDETTWLEQVRTDLQMEAYQNAIRAIRDRYEFLVNYDAVRLNTPQGLYD